MPALGTSLKCQPGAELTPALDIHTPPPRNDVLSLAPRYLARIPKYWGRNVGSETSTGDIFPCAWLEKHLCASSTLKTGRSRPCKRYFHISSLSFGVWSLTGGKEAFVYPKVNFSSRVWSFSGSVVSEAAANNLRNSGHISLVPSALTQTIPAANKSQDNLLHMESWRKLSQNMSSCKENPVFLYRPQNPCASMR